MENSFHEITNLIPPKDVPIWLLLQIDGDNIIFEGRYLGFSEESHVFQIKSGGLCCPLKWAEFENLPQIKEKNGKNES